MSHALLLAAVAYARLGMPVFPVRPRAKTPLTEHGFLEASVDQAQITEWWRRWPEANIGMPTGEASGISVVDIDGPAGVDSLKMLDLPKTWTVQTPRGTGYHLYFQYTPDLKQGANLLPGIDGRNQGGYVLLPPSYVVTDDYEGTYTVRRDVLPFARLEPVPAALGGRTRRENLPPVPRDPSWVVTALQGVSGGQRNDTAARLAGYLHRKGLRRDEVLLVLEGFAAKCDPPMDRWELERTVDSVERYLVPGAIETRGDMDAWDYLR